MATRVTANPFSDGGFGGGIMRLGSMLLGAGGEASEERRFNALSQAELARARAGYDDARTRDLDRRFQAREALSRGLAPGAGGVAPGFGDLVAALPQHLAWLDTSEVGGPRAGVGLALAGGSPEQQARAVGGMGGDAGNTVYGVQTVSGDRRYAADRSAGAQVAAATAAANIAQAGQNFRFLRGDVNPGADGVYVGPDRRRALGLGDEVAPVFLPGAANVGANSIRVAPVAGPVENATPQMATTAGPRSPADQLGDAVANAVLAGRPVPNLEAAGVTPREVVGGASGVTQGLRNEGAMATTTARIEARAAEVERRIEAAAALAGQNNEARAALAEVQGRLRTQLQTARDDATRERLVLGAEQQMERLEATLRSREGEGAANRQAAQQRAETAVAGRAAAAQNRPLSAATADAVRAEVNSQLDANVRGATRQPQIVAWVEGRATDYLRQGDPPGLAVERAINDARNEAGLVARDSWLFGSGARMNPGAPPARTGGAPTAAPQNYRPDPQPQALSDGAATLPAARRQGQIYQTPRGPMMWTGTGWVPAQ